MKQCVVAQDLESMREAGRNVNLSFIAVREIDAVVAAEGRRAAANIDGDVVDLSANDGDQLALRRGVLEVKAAQGPLDGKRKIVLDEPYVDAGLAVSLFVPGFDEEATVIGEYLRLDDEKPLERCLGYLHRPAQSCARRASAITRRK